jgi:hypothetical protein
MEIIFDLEVEYIDWTPEQMWKIEMPNCVGYEARMKFIHLEFVSTLKEVYDVSIVYLRSMETNRNTTFKMHIKRGDMEDTYDIHNEDDMLTMILKYS